jgi:hypothetical protein
MPNEIVSTMVIRDQVAADIRRGATGREISSAQADLFDEIKAWLHSDAADWNQHPLTDRFRNELVIHKLPQVSCSFQRAFRMQWVEGTPNCSRMGAPDQRITQAGRYNEPKDPVLYLSLEHCGALREMQNTEKPSGASLWVQEYKLPLDQLSVVDIRAKTVDDWLGTVFDYCEIHERTIDPRNPYSFSRRIAALVKQAGYDCMFIPGVRGDPEGRYTNAIVFTLGPHHGRVWQVGKPEEVSRR